MNKKLRNLLLSVLVLFPAVQSCTKSETVHLPEKADNRVYFIYMAADNTLGSYAVSNLAAIAKTVSWQNIGNGRVIVFYDPRGDGGCEMREYKAGGNKQPSMTVLAQYGDMNTASPATLEFAISEMKRFSTAGGRTTDSYILDIWSHGNSWEPMNPAPPAITPRAVAVEGDGYTKPLYGMNLEDFADAVEPGLFDAIIMAECYGASLEMIYLIRDKTEYIIGSAAEMPADGIQYDKVLPYVFLKQFNYEAFCQSYFDYWKSRPGYGATVAWFDCGAFTDDFVDVMAEIYNSIEYSQLLSRMNTASVVLYNGYIPVPAFEVQYYDRPSTVLKKYFDLGDMVNKAFPLGGDLHGRFWAAYNDIVKYAISTGNIFEATIDPSRFSGMTSYMMDLEWSYESYNYTSLNNEYRDTEWYRVAYPNN